jgi:hypothetical protein
VFGVRFVLWLLFLMAMRNLARSVIPLCTAAVLLLLRTSQTNAHPQRPPKLGVHESHHHWHLSNGSLGIK